MTAPRLAELTERLCPTSGGGFDVLVLGPEKQIEVHRQPHGGQFAEHAVHGPGGTLTSAAVPGFAVELARLFAA